MVKNLPTMQETRVQSLGQENPLEKEMATHSSILVPAPPSLPDLGCPSKRSSHPSESPSRSAPVLRDSLSERPLILWGGGFLSEHLPYSPHIPWGSSLPSVPHTPGVLPPLSPPFCRFLPLLVSPLYAGTSDPLGSLLGNPEAPQVPDFRTPSLPFLGLCPSRCSLSGLRAPQPPGSGSPALLSLPLPVLTSVLLVSPLDVSCAADPFLRLLLCRGLLPPTHPTPHRAFSAPSPCLPFSPLLCLSLSPFLSLPVSGSLTPIRPSWLCRSGIAGSYGSSISSFLRSLHTVLHSDSNHSYLED